MLRIFKKIWKSLFLSYSVSTTLIHYIHSICSNQTTKGCKLSMLEQVAFFLLQYNLYITFKSKQQGIVKTNLNYKRRVRIIQNVSPLNFSFLLKLLVLFIII